MNYVYIKSEPRLWTVGFYDPAGKWHSESDHEDREEAAERVAWLNGGGLKPPVDGPEPRPRVFFDDVLGPAPDDPREINPRCSHTVPGTCDYCPDENRDEAEEAFNARLLEEV